MISNDISRRENFLNLKREKKNYFITSNNIQIPSIEKWRVVIFIAFQLNHSLMMKLLGSGGGGREKESYGLRVPSVI